MRVAFDVNGTLGDSPRARKLLAWFQIHGHTVVVWSNCFSSALDCVKKFKIDAPAQMKTTRWDLHAAVDPESEYFDIAVDDDREQNYLAARRFVIVEDIPEDEADFDDFIAKKLLEPEARREVYYDENC